MTKPLSTQLAHGQGHRGVWSGPRNSTDTFFCPYFARHPLPSASLPVRYSKNKKNTLMTEFYEEKNMV